MFQSSNDNYLFQNLIFQKFKNQIYDEMVYEEIEYLRLNSILYIFANDRIQLRKVIKQKLKKSDL